MSDKKKDGKMEIPENINIGDGNIARLSPKNKKEPIHRAFADEKEMNENAEQAYQFNRSVQDKNELEKGFDIHDINSVLAFEPDYTPIGNTVVVKELPEKLMQGNLYLVDSSDFRKKYVVIVPGLLVKTLEKGDLVALTAPVGQKDIVYQKRTFKGIYFMEVDYYNVSGVYKPIKEMAERMAKADAAYRKENDVVKDAIVSFLERGEAEKAILSGNIDLGKSQPVKDRTIRIIDNDGDL